MDMYSITWKHSSRTFHTRPERLSKYSFLLCHSSLHNTVVAIFRGHKEFSFFLYSYRLESKSSSRSPLFLVCFVALPNNKLLVITNIKICLSLHSYTQQTFVIIAFKMLITETNVNNDNKIETLFYKYGFIGPTCTASSNKIVFV